MSQLLLRIKTKDGTERLPAPAGASLGQVRQLIEQQLNVPVSHQALHRSMPGPTPMAPARKGEATLQNRPNRREPRGNIPPI